MSLANRIMSLCLACVLCHAYFSFEQCANHLWQVALIPV